MKLDKQGIQKNNRHSTETVVRGNTEFAFDLYQMLRAKKGNLFFSPYSISAALAMTYAGARGNTEAQLAKTLHFAEQKQLHPAFASLEAALKTVQEKGHILLKTANALWPQAGYPFLEEFLALMRECYVVSVADIDYYRDPEAARHKINAWVEEKTEKKIRELIQPVMLNSLTRLVLTNAVYFKGDWASQFKKKLTNDSQFLITSSENVNVSMMSQKDVFRYGKDDGLQILELPYVGDDLAMLILLPKEIDGIGKLEKKLAVGTLQQWMSNLRKTKVQVYLPRFKLNCGFELRDVLSSMGIRDAFDRYEANFSGMDGRQTEGLYFAEVLHKAFIEMNEEGTEAAAATAVVVRCLGISKAPPTPVFRADHPFVFLIYEKSTQSILFLGRVVNPRDAVSAD